ncbi:hypothetical protein [Phocaeicola plebeius]|nr:hypothetical protein [Phocaeicola plebeius]
MALPHWLAAREVLEVILNGVPSTMVSWVVTMSYAAVSTAASAKV